ncbi:MFS transporter [Streptomyces antimicrobicus]|uniref:MFS transporter n=2 Tax=Streptomyces antimicrobicus TaxID=2883108 RepID=A0ABS8B2E0_9ACTN|nr:MFS transporter [Streptomyces antimicrobicus]MCB5178766.1 MFS transporter [Streptomyces antimicrobicus]
MPAPASASSTTPAPAPAAAPSSDRSPWRALRHRGMRWWAAANFVSNIGTWTQLTVQNLLVLQITGSAAVTGLSVSLQAAPGLLLGLAGGAVVDRWSHKITATVCQALLAAVAFTTCLLVALDLLNLPALMALAVVTGVVATVDGPACSLLGNGLVPAQDVPSAIGVGSLVHSAGRLVGAALAGVTVAAFGTAAAYAVNGLSFLFVAGVIPFLRPAPGALPAAAEAPVPAPSGALQEDAPGVRAGLRYFLGRPRLVALAAMNAVSALFGRNYSLTLVVLVTGPLAGDAASFSWVSTTLAAGGIVGAVLGARLRSPGVRLVALLTVAGALLQVLAGLVPSLALLLVLVLPMAVAESVGDTAQSTLLQTDPPARMRGRVLGAWSTVRTGWGLAAPPTLGLLMEFLGVRAALVLGGLVIAAAIGAGRLAHRRHSAGRPALGRHFGARPAVPAPRQPAAQAPVGPVLARTVVPAPVAPAPTAPSDPVAVPALA